MDSNNMNLYNPAVVSQPQQNGGFEMDAKFYQVNSFGPPPILSDNQIQDKMSSPGMLPPPQTMQNSTYYWSDFNQVTTSSQNWGYNYQNYSVLPQPPVAIPVSDFGSMQNGAQAQVPVQMGVQAFQPAEQNNAVMVSNPGPEPAYYSQGMHPQNNFHPPPPDASPGSRHSAFQYVHNTTMHGAIKPETINETDMQSAQQVDSNQRNAGVSPAGLTNHKPPMKSKPPKAPRRRSTGVSTKSKSSSSSSEPNTKSVNTNGGNSGESYTCPICSKVYEHRDSLRRHKRDFHKIEVASAKARGQPTNFQCDICGKYLSNRCSLKRHKKSALCSKTLETAADNSNSQTKIDNAVLSSSDLTQSSYGSEKLTFHGQPEAAGTSHQLNGEIKVKKPKAKKPKSKLEHDKPIAQNGKCESCHICKKEFGNKRGLSKHLKRVHKPASSTTITDEKEPTEQGAKIASSDGDNNSVTVTNDNQTVSGESSTSQNEQKPAIEEAHPFSDLVQVNNYEFHNSQGMTSEISHPPPPPSVTSEVVPSSTEDDTTKLTGKDRKKCDMCDKVLKKVNIARHMKSAHKIEAQDDSSDSKIKYAKVECNYCQAVMLKGNLPRHKRSHHKLEYEKEKEMQGSPSSVEVPRSSKKAKYEAPASNGDGNFNDEYRPNNEMKPEAHQFHPQWPEPTQIPGVNMNPPDFRHVNDVAGVVQVQQYPIVTQAPNNPEMQMNSLDYRSFNPVMQEDPNRMTYTQPANNQPMDMLGYGHMPNSDPGQAHLNYGQPPNHVGINMVDYGNLDRQDAFQNQIIFAQTPNNQIVDMMDYTTLGSGNLPRQDLHMFSPMTSHSELDLLNYRNLDGTQLRDDAMLFTQNDQNLNLLNYPNVDGNIVDVHHQNQPPPPVFHPPPPNNPEMQTYRHLESAVQTSDLNVNVVAAGSHAKQTPAAGTSECPICEKMVPTADLYQHKISHELICHICGKDDIRLPDVPAHGQTHVASLDCELCGYKAQAKIKLWEHMNTHLRIKPLICLECGWSFGNSGSVQYHMKSQHSSPGDMFQCDHCDKSFVTEQAKRGHELSHYGTTCPFCKEEFPRKKDLADHIKANHRRKRQAS